MSKRPDCARTDGHSCPYDSSAHRKEKASPGSAYVRKVGRDGVFLDGEEGEDDDATWEVWSGGEANEQLAECPNPEAARRIVAALNGDPRHAEATLRDIARLWSEGDQNGVERGLEVLASMIECSDADKLGTVVHDPGKICGKLVAYGEGIRGLGPCRLDEGHGDDCNARPAKPWVCPDCGASGVTDRTDLGACRACVIRKNKDKSRV